jgi:outer membrane lipoprotein-sorting protein
MGIMKALKWLTPATAGCVVLIAILWNVLGGTGAQEAYAAAIDGVIRARTFSCKQILEITQDDKKLVMEQAFMFKEPDRERHEWRAGVDDRFIGDVTITDYGRRRRLHLRPSDKTASLMDHSADFVIDTDTGKLKLSQLHTGLRDRLLAWRAGAVADCGSVELDGRSVRLLRSRRGKSAIEVWVDPQTDLPVQIAIDQPQYKQRWVYTSIQIDVELDDDLFSIDPPEGYSLFRGAREERRSIPKRIVGPCWDERSHG